VVDRPARAAASFGFSRQSCYTAAAALHAGGLAALVPAKPGLRGAHKLTAEVVDHLEQLRPADPGLRPAALARAVADRFGVSVHPRSVKRALARREAPASGPGGPTVAGSSHDVDSPTRRAAEDPDLSPPSVTVWKSIRFPDKLRRAALTALSRRLARRRIAGGCALVAAAAWRSTFDDNTAASGGAIAASPLVDSRGW